MNTLKNRMNLKIQIPKLSSQEDQSHININNSNQVTKNTISQITNNIYISGYLIGQNLSYLKNNNFTHVINCCVGSSLSSPDINNSKEDSLAQLYERNNIKYLSIFLRDDPEADIIYNFLQIINFLESDRQIENKKILFHCIEGISRAPALISGYLMWKQNLRTQNAIFIVKE